MPINRLHHIGMSVPNLDIGKRFYCDVLGFEEARTVGFGSEASVDAILGLKKASAKVAFLRRGDLWIEMFEFSSPSPKANDKDVLVCEYGFSHLCLDVTDVDTVYEQCCDKGMQFHTAPVSTHGVKTTYGRDPFGNVIEIQEIMNEAQASESWKFSPSRA